MERLLTEEGNIFPTRLYYIFISQLQLNYSKMHVCELRNVDESDMALKKSGEQKFLREASPL